MAWTLPNLLTWARIIAIPLLVALFFMHVRHSSALTKLILVGALLWLGIMLGFTMADFTTRGWFGVLGR